MPVVSVTSKGQATLPKEMREELGIKAPGRVHVSLENGRIVMEPVLSPEELKQKYAGALRRGPTRRQLQEEERAAEQRRERRLDRPGRAT